MQKAISKYISENMDEDMDHLVLADAKAMFMYIVSAEERDDDDVGPVQIFGLIIRKLQQVNCLKVCLAELSALLCLAVPDALARIRLVISTCIICVINAKVLMVTFHFPDGCLKSSNIRVYFSSSSHFNLSK